jgi:hypothetical protein
MAVLIGIERAVAGHGSKTPDVFAKATLREAAPPRLWGIPAWSWAGGSLLPVAEIIRAVDSASGRHHVCAKRF